MAFASEAELITFVKTTMGSSYTKVDTAGYNSAVTLALTELHWTIPVDDDQKEYWMVERTKRHLTYILLFESADRFQYKKLSLQHRFDHYMQLIKLMDSAFTTALDDDPSLFDVSTWPNLTFYLTNGFVYDIDGEDLTYLDLD